MKKRVLAMGLTVVLGCSQMMVVHGDTIDEVKRQRAQTSSQLEATKNKINNLEDQKNQLIGEIDSLDARLIQTIAAINGLKEDITAKTVEIEETKVQLAAAEEDRQGQYDAMKKRIQYLYENGGNISWFTVLLSDGNISDLLDSASRTQELYDYDKKALEEYAVIVQQVTDLGIQLEDEKADLESMEAAQEEEQHSLEGMLEEKKATCSDYENQIAAAESVASQYRKLIQQQNVQIEVLVAEQQRQAEEARRQEAARQQAAAEASKQQSSGQQSDNSSSNKNNNNTNSNTNGNTNSNTNSNANGNTNSNTNSNANGNTNSNTNSNVNSNKDSSSNKGTGGQSAGGSSGVASSGQGDPKPTSQPKPSSGQHSSSGVSGQDIINYAVQFVGNPYVSGGNSLTNGVDCSGYIHEVYAHFGYSVPRYSGDFRSAGRGVSYAEAQPGDIICYDGHVALYMGGGSIVHASNSAPYPQGGIKISGNANYKTILAVRRVIG